MTHEYLYKWSVRTRVLYFYMAFEQKQKLRRHCERLENFKTGVFFCVVLSMPIGRYFFVACQIDNANVIKHVFFRVLFFFWKKKEPDVWSQRKDVRFWFIYTKCCCLDAACHKTTHNRLQYLFILSKLRVLLNCFDVIQLHRG